MEKAVLTVVLFVYISILIILSVWRPRIFLFVLFGSKLTIDLTWDHTMIGSWSALHLIGIGFPLWAAAHVAVYRPAVLRHPMFKPMAFLLVSNMVASVWGLANSHFRWFEIVASPIDLYHVLEWNTRFAGILASFVVVPLVMNRNGDQMKIVMLTIAGGIVPLIIGLGQVVTSGWERLFVDSAAAYEVALFPRVTGGYHSAASFAIVLFLLVVASGLVAAFAVQSIKKTQIRMAAGFLAIAAGGVLYFTFSRTFWIAASAFVLLWLVLLKKKRLLAVAAGLLVALIVYLPATSKRFEREWALVSKPLSLVENVGELHKLGTGRLWLWSDAVRHFTDLDPVSKLIGSGGSYGSHNLWIQVLLRNGLVGILVMVGFVGLLLKHLVSRFRAHRDPLHAAIVSLAICVMLVANMFTQVWDHWTFSLVFWTIMGWSFEEGTR